MAASVDRVGHQIAGMLTEEFGRAAVNGEEPRAVAGVADDEGMFSRRFVADSLASIDRACRELAEKVDRPIRFVAYGSRMLLERDDGREHATQQDCAIVYVVDGDGNIAAQVTPYRIDDNATAVFFDDPALDGSKATVPADIPQLLFDVLRSANRDV